MLLMQSKWEKAILSDNVAINTVNMLNLLHSHQNYTVIKNKTLYRLNNFTFSSS
jgi:hypothetical protein